MSYISTDSRRRIRRNFRSTVSDENFGWVQAVIQGVMAAKGLIKGNPQANAYKKKLDKLSVGKHLTRLIKGSGVSKAEKTWDDWRKVAMGKVPGSQLDNVSFEEAFKGMWDTNNKDFPGYGKYKNDREQFKHDMAAEIVKGILLGKVDNSDTAGSIYTKIVKPWLEAMKPGGIPAKRTDITQLIVDLIDRFIFDLPIGRADMEEYRQGSLSIPTLSQGLSRLSPDEPTGAPVPTTPAPVVTAPTTPTTPAVPVTTLPAPVLAPFSMQPVLPAPVTTISLPSNATQGDLASVVEKLTAQFQQAMQGQSVTQEQAFKYALESLQSSGIAPTEQVQEITKEVTAKATDKNAWVLPAAIGAAALLLLARRKRS